MCGFGINNDESVKWYWLQIQQQDLCESLEYLAKKALRTWALLYQSECSSLSRLNYA